MKKITFLFVAMLAFCWQTNAQDTCGAATPVTPGTTVGTTINDATLGGQGDTVTTRDAAWFAYTATGDGTITVASCGGGADTRLYIFDDCAGTAIANGDDECDLGTGSNFASEVADLAVTNGTTYYIEWDDRWSSGPFDWTLTFTPAPLCTSTVVDSSTVMEDCVAGTFTVDVVVSVVGDGDVITDGTNDYTVVAGTITAGPYTNGTSVTLDVAHTDGACDFSLGSFSDACPANQDTCATADTVTEGTITGTVINDGTLGGQGDTVTTRDSAWFAYTAAADGTITVGSCGGGADTRLYIFDACGGTAIANGDDECDLGTGSNFASEVADLAVTAGTTYYIEWDDRWSSGPFDWSITYTAPPACIPATVDSSTVVEDCVAGTFTVDVVISDAGDAGTVIDDGTTTYPVVAGTVTAGPYADGALVTLNLVGVDSACDSSLGDFSFTCPQNQDNCVSADTVTEGTITGTVINDGSLGGQGDTVTTRDAAWFAYTAPGDGTINVGSCGGGADTRLYIFDACGGTAIASGDDECDLGTGSNFASEVDGLAVTAGTTYYIEWDDRWSSGPFDWSITFTPAPLCTSAVVDSSTIVEDCVAGTFTVDIVVSVVGDGDVITDGTNDYTVVAGTITAGPYPADGTSVTLDVAHTDGACDFSLGAFDFGCPPANDEAAGAITLNIGDTLCEGKTEATNVGSTLSAEIAQTCGGADGSDVWFKVVVPSTGEVTVETSASVNSPMMTDTAMSVYSGMPGALVELACNDDATGLYSEIALTGLTPGDTLLIRVKPFGGATKGNFAICAWSPSTLGIEDNSFEGFSYYPNPVQNTLTLNSQVGIDNVSVFNIVGQRIMNITDAQGVQNIDMSALQSGTYIVQVSIDNQTKTIRVLKE